MRMQDCGNFGKRDFKLHFLSKKKYIYIYIYIEIIIINFIKSMKWRTVLPESKYFFSS